ncbi:extensin family protein [Roseibium sp.]|uniref:extensin-like domain-containing protein n=1 Tax=Roseibium sp. TaxID=1936156 RepID=UPI003BA9E633
MHKRLRFGFSATVLLITSSVLAVAAEPVPAPKPLAETDKTEPGNAIASPVPTPKPGQAPGVGSLPSKDAAACDLPGMVFEILPPVRGEFSGDAGCGIESPVRLTGIQREGTQVPLKGAVTVSCAFAKTFSEWLQSDVLPAAETHFDGGIRSITTGPGYQCRRRNNQPDGKLSEHALGKAVDLSGFAMKEGGSVSVETDWGKDTPEGRFLTDIHKSACARFTTVLSPEGDEFHKSHLHVDIGCHGKTCTYLICQ